MPRTALVLGITGGIGAATAAALHRRGWRIRALHRDPASAAGRFARDVPIDWIAGDAMRTPDVTNAADGADVIVHGVNPPGYRNWRGLAMPMLANTIAAAERSGARILFPGNVYNFGPDAGTVISESAPQNPLTRKGRIRVEMETMLREAANRGCRSLVVRAGDFFGSRGAGGWFENVLVKRGKPVKAVVYPGAADAGHAWAYLPDLAETFARLAERESELGAFETFHFGGHYLARGIDMAETIRRVAGVPSAPIRKLPWLALYAAAPFNETFREMLEMRYLWQRPLRLDNGRLLRLLGDEPHTPLDVAVRESLRAIGCGTTSGTTTPAYSTAG